MQVIINNLANLGTVTGKSCSKPSATTSRSRSVVALTVTTCMASPGNPRAESGLGGKSAHQRHSKRETSQRNF